MDPASTPSLHDALLNQREAPSPDSVQSTIGSEKSFPRHRFTLKSPFIDAELALQVCSSYTYRQMGFTYEDSHGPGRCGSVS